MTEKKRLDGFNKELGVIIDKYKIGLVAKPAFTADGRVGATLELVDTTKLTDKKKELVK